MFPSTFSCIFCLVDRPEEDFWICNESFIQFDWQIANKFWRSWSIKRNRKAFRTVFELVTLCFELEFRFEIFAKKVDIRCWIFNGAKSSSSRQLAGFIAERRCAKILFYRKHFLGFGKIVCIPMYIIIYCFRIILFCNFRRLVLLIHFSATLTIES